MEFFVAVRGLSAQHPPHILLIINIHIIVFLELEAGQSTSIGVRLEYRIIAELIHHPND